MDGGVVEVDWFSQAQEGDVVGDTVGTGVSGVRDLIHYWNPLCVWSIFRLPLQTGYYLKDLYNTLQLLSTINIPAVNNVATVNSVVGFSTEQKWTLLTVTVIFNKMPTKNALFHIYFFSMVKLPLYEL